MTWNIHPEEPLALEVTEAIRSGDVACLERLLEENPGLATARIGGTGFRGDTMSRSLLHVATDFPGHYPEITATIATLLSHGGDIDAPFQGPHTETPLHWAASCDDVLALDALLDAGANIEAPGAVIGGGTPLADAVAFGQWNAARRLIERGARSTLWQSAALGLMDRVRQAFTAKSAPVAGDITQAFWCACHGGQRAAAEFLLERGADINWVGYDGLTPLDAAQRASAGELVQWLESRGALRARNIR